MAGFNLSLHHSPLPLLLQLRGLVLDGLAKVLLSSLQPLRRVQVGLQLNTHTHALTLLAP